MSYFTRPLSRALLLALVATPAISSAQTAMKSATWWNPAEGGWGVFTIDQGSVIAPGWFTYDTDGEPVWFLVPGATPQPDGSYKGDILRFTGVPFAQIAGSAADPASKIGEATVRFTGDKQMQFTTVINGATQTKSLTRFNFNGSDLVCKSSTAGRASASNYSDLWSSPGSIGWGVHLSHLDNDLYATWYTYDTDREAIFLIGAAKRQADGSFTGPLYRQKNGTPFPQINGASPSTGTDQIGSVTLRFTDGENGTFSYTVGNVTQSKALKRSQFGSIASVCEVQPYETTNSGGSGDDCMPPYTIGDKRSVRTVSTSNGVTAAPETHEERIVREATFNGQAGLLQEYTRTSGTATGMYTRNYVANGNGTTVSFGAEAFNPQTGAQVSTSTNEPARIELQRAFSIGESRSLAWTVRGSAQGFTTSTQISTTWKLVARENVTVAAGTFPACKFDVVIGESSTISGVSTKTDLTGTAWTSPTYGLLKRNLAGTSAVGGFGQSFNNTLSSTEELLSATIAGQSTR